MRGFPRPKLHVNVAAVEAPAETVPLEAPTPGLDRPASRLAGLRGRGLPCRRSGTSRKRPMIRSRGKSPTCQSACDTRMSWATLSNDFCESKSITSAPSADSLGSPGPASGAGHARAEAEARTRGCRIPQSFDRWEYCELYESIDYGWDARSSHPAGGFGDFCPWAPAEFDPTHDGPRRTFISGTHGAWSANKSPGMSVPGLDASHRRSTAIRSPAACASRQVRPWRASRFRRAGAFRGRGTAR